MADTIKTASEVKYNFNFFDGDTRLVTMDNPRSDLTASDVKQLGAWAKINNPIIGDKGGASCTGIGEAYTVKKTTTNLDLK